MKIWLKKERLLRVSGIVFGLLVAVACTPNISPDSYALGSVGQINRVVKGEIISARQVQIRGTASGIGAGTGLAGGAIAGSAIGGSSRTNALAGLAGGVLGGIAGAVIEENMTHQQGREYVVQTSNGALITIVQGAAPSFVVGNKVLVIYGSPARVIADPSS